MKPGDEVVVRVGPKASMVCVVQSMNATCKSCGADGVWVKTPKGKWMIVEPEHGDLEADSLISHYSRCPQADEWRGKHD